MVVHDPFVAHVFEYPEDFSWIKETEVIVEKVLELVLIIRGKDQVLPNIPYHEKFVNMLSF